MTRIVSQKRRKPIIAVDFDGILARPAWPDIGEEIPGATEFLTWLASKDYETVLWTCRTEKPLDDALDWLAERGFPREWWTTINDNTPTGITHFGNNCRKVGADIFIDDKAVNFPWIVCDDSQVIPNWSYIQTAIIQQCEHKCNANCSKTNQEIANAN